MSSGCVQMNGRTVRRDAMAVRKQFTGVVEQQYPVAEQAPALFWVRGHNPGRVVVGS
jgi:hypothetical protein